MRCGRTRRDMFGFIRPLKPELRVREAERFQAVYCGLCHAIRSRYGRLHTLFLSYDMAFMALVLESLLPEGASVADKRCDASPVRAKKVLQTDEVLAYTADISVLLTYHKLSDSVADETGAKRLLARFIRMLASGGHRKARARLPETDEAMAQRLRELAEVERARTPSIDRAADPFARLLSALVPQTCEEEKARVLRELFYHIGRWVYLIDACQDVKEDFKSGNYNPVALRYALTAPTLEAVKEPLENTLARSLAAVHAAFALLDIRRDRELIENIICLGLPTVTRQVLDGTYQSNGGQSRHGSL